MNNLLNSVNKSKASSDPFPHWSIKNVLDSDSVNDLLKIPSDDFGYYFYHKHRTSIYSCKDQCAKHPVMQRLVDSFSNKKLIAKFEQLSDKQFGNCYVKVEYNNDEYDFADVCHTDGPDKLLTFICYVDDNISPLSYTTLGTTLFDSEARPVKRVKYKNNAGFFFFPEQEGDGITYHAYTGGIYRDYFTSRKILIVHYLSETNEESEKYAHACSSSNTS